MPLGSLSANEAITNSSGLARVRYIAPRPEQLRSGVTSKNVTIRISHPGGTSYARIRLKASTQPPPAPILPPISTGDTKIATPPLGTKPDTSPGWQSPSGQSRNSEADIKPPITPDPVVKLPPEGDSLPPWIPAAAGAAAGATAATGALLMMAASGVKPREVWDGMKDLMSQGPSIKEPPQEEQNSYDEALEQFREEKSLNKPVAGDLNEKGEIWDAGVHRWVKQEDHEILTGEKTRKRSHDEDGEIQKAFDQVSEEKKKLEDIQKGRVDHEKEWIQEDLEEIFQREVASSRVKMSEERSDLLRQLYEKSDTLAGMDDRVEAQRELEQLSAIIDKQKKPGYRPQYTFRDLAEDMVLRGGATALDVMFTKGYANAAITAFQTAREDIRYGADLKTALYNGAVHGGIEAATFKIGYIAAGKGINPLGTMATTSGAVRGSLSFQDALEEGATVIEAAERGVTDGTVAGLQTFAIGKVIETGGGKLAPSSGSKGTRPGFPKGYDPAFKTVKGIPKTPPEVMQKINSTRKHIVVTKDGKTLMDLDEALKLQQDTRAMRALKSGEAPDIRKALGNTLKDVKKMHDADVIQKFKAGNPRLKDAEIRIEDISTRGKTTDFSTDRDYRMVYKNKKDNWVEVPKEQWQHHSQESFAEVTVYNPNKFRASLSTAEKARFDKMARTEQLDFHQQKSNWKATDKAHIEASRDYSDQHVDLKTGTRRQLPEDEINILNVYRGKAKLIDPEAHGQMYHSKVVAELNAGNKPEAFVQAKKGGEALEHIRVGYEKQKLNIRKLNPKLQKGIELVKENAESIGRGNTRLMTEIEEKLKDLGFQNINDFSYKVSSQIGGL